MVHGNGPNFTNLVRLSWPFQRGSTVFHWSLFSRVHLTISQHWFRWWLGTAAPVWGQVITWSNTGSQWVNSLRPSEAYRQTSNTSHTLGNKIVDVLRCTWSIACRRCSDYIFILELTPDFNGFGKDNCKMRQETFKFWGLVHLILEVWWHMYQ